METRISKNDNWCRTYQLILVLGFILSIRSICSFIVMNVVLGKTPSINSIFYQRLFVSKITYTLIIPGICMVLTGIIFSCKKRMCLRRNTWIIISYILVMLIVLNSIYIVLLADKVTSIAIHQKEVMANIPEFSKFKSREDSFGGINLIMLLALLGIIIYKFKE